MKIYLVELETKKFTYRSVGKSKNEAKENLVQCLIKEGIENPHALVEDTTTMEINTGEVYRDFFKIN